METIKESHSCSKCRRKNSTILDVHPQSIYLDPYTCTQGLSEQHYRKVYKDNKHQKNQCIYCEIVNVGKGRATLVEICGVTRGWILSKCIL